MNFQALAIAVGKVAIEQSDIVPVNGGGIDLGNPLWLDQRWVALILREEKWLSGSGVDFGQIVYPDSKLCRGDLEPFQARVLYCRNDLGQTHVRPVD